MFVFVCVHISQRERDQFTHRHHYLPILQSTTAVWVGGKKQQQNKIETRHESARSLCLLLYIISPLALARALFPLSISFEGF